MAMLGAGEDMHPDLLPTSTAADTTTQDVTTPLLVNVTQHDHQDSCPEAACGALPPLPASTAMPLTAVNVMVNTPVSTPVNTPVNAPVNVAVVPLTAADVMQHGNVLPGNMVLAATSPRVGGGGKHSEPDYLVNLP